MNPNPADMLVFLTVVEARSFTLAADRLARTKSAISQTLSRLEEDLGCKLLYRSTRALSLTEAGAQFYAHCQDMQRCYDNALGVINTAGAATGTLTITAPHALGLPLLVPVISEFTAHFPKIDVRLISSDAAIDLIDAKIDLAVRVGEPRHQTARISKLGSIGESLYASPACINRMSGLPQQLSDLAGWGHIANDWQGNPVTYSTPDGQTLKVVPRIRCNSLPDILHLVESGAGVARLPDLAATPGQQRGSLTALMSLGAAPVYSLHQFERYPPQKVKQFIALLRTRLKTHGGKPTTGHPPR